MSGIGRDSRITPALVGDAKIPDSPLKVGDTFHRHLKSLPQGETISATIIARQEEARSASASVEYALPEVEAVLSGYGLNPSGTDSTSGLIYVPVNLDVARALSKLHSVNAIIEDQSGGGANRY